MISTHSFTTTLPQTGPDNVHMLKERWQAGRQIVRDAIEAR